MCIRDRHGIGRGFARGAGRSRHYLHFQQPGDGSAGYEVAAARYLAKPLDAAKLREALLHCCAAYMQPREIVLPTASGQSRIHVSAIVYVLSLIHISGIIIGLIDAGASALIQLITH